MSALGKKIQPEKRFPMTAPSLKVSLPFKIDGELCRVVFLTKGLISIISDTQTEKLSKYKWSACLNKSTGLYYAVRHDRRRQHGMVMMHREILGLAKGDVRTGDHRNHDTLDNRDSNLRIATKSEQQWNKRVSRRNINGFKGISFHKRDKLYRAEINLGSLRVMCIGYFKDPATAARAYDAAALWFFGKFACTNFSSDPSNHDSLPIRVFEKFARVRPPTPEMLGYFSSIVPHLVPTDAHRKTSSD